MTSSITLSSDAAYRWYSWVHEDALASIVVIKCTGKCVLPTAWVSENASSAQVSECGGMRRVVSVEAN
jgi:hypothetical protein